MLVSSKGRYALRVMLDLAQHSVAALTPLKDVAARQEISLKYLESIASLLARAGLIEGQHGKGGGYRLTRPLSGYTVLEILDVTETCFSTVECIQHCRKGCHRAADCLTLPLWLGLDRQIQEYLRNTTLQDLLTDAKSEKNGIL